MQEIECLISFGKKPLICIQMKGKLLNVKDNIGLNMENVVGQMNAHAKGICRILIFGFILLKTCSIHRLVVIECRFKISRSKEVTGGNKILPANQPLTVWRLYATEAVLLV